MAKKTVSVASLISDINKRLDNIEDLMMWTVRADQRFVVGNRVEFSPMADRAGLSKGRKGGVRTGKVTAVGGMWATVLLDGYKRASDFHHGFFQVTTKRKGKR